MIPGLSGLNPKKMQGLMKQMGISQDEIPTSKVTIEKPDNTKIIFESPSVSKINMQGQEIWQVVGNAKEESEELFTEQDVKTVIEKTQCTKHQAQEVLESTKGDLAEAILELNS